MVSYTRYAIYHVPRQEPLARFGADWLGWDIVSGAPAHHPAVAGLDVDLVTRQPRKYGFHATLKPPFRLASGQDAGALARAVGAMSASLAPVTLDGLRLARLGRFLALVPMGDTAALTHLAADLVAGLDAFRAPPEPQDLARRRAARLTAAQDCNLLRWGYPYVMEDFRFHMTLSGKLDDIAPVEAALARLLDPVPLSPYRIDSLDLVAERTDGFFESVHRYALTASSA